MFHRARVVIGKLADVLGSYLGNEAGSNGGLQSFYHASHVTLLSSDRVPGRMGSRNDNESKPSHANFLHLVRVHAWRIWSCCLQQEQRWRSIKIGSRPLLRQFDTWGKENYPKPLRP